MSRSGAVKLDQSTVAGRYRQHVHVSERNEWRYRGWEFTGVMPLSFEAAGRVGNADHLTRGIERRHLYREGLRPRLAYGARSDG